MASAPSSVALPPMNPLMCTNTPPGMPLTRDNSSSLNPLHVAGSGQRLSKLPGATAMACTRHCLARSSWTDGEHWGVGEREGGGGEGKSEGRNMGESMRWREQGDGGERGIS